MAEPGDPKTPADAQDEHDHDAEIGFVSPASLAGRARASEPGPEPEDEPDLFDPPALPPESRLPESRLPEPGPFDPAGTVQPVARFAPHSPQSSRPSSSRPHADVRARMTQGETPRAPAPAAPMRLYAVYVLILLAVPTLGLSCLVALLAVMRPERGGDALAASQALYQKRTVFGAVAAAVVGAILVVVNIGVLVLFAVAIWILARGAYGVLKLKSGQAVPNPRSWLF